MRHLFQRQCYFRSFEAPPFISRLVRTETERYEQESKEQHDSYDEARLTQILWYLYFFKCAHDNSIAEGIFNKK